MDTLSSSPSPMGTGEELVSDRPYGLGTLAGGEPAATPAFARSRARPRAERIGATEPSPREGGEAAGQALVTGLDQAYALLARLPESAEDLLQLLRTHRSLAGALDPVRLADGAELSRSDLTRELRAWVGARNTLRDAIAAAREAAPFDLAEERAILRAAEAVPAGFLGFPPGMQDRVADARRRVQVAERFTEALYLRNVEVIIDLWDNDAALRELTLAADEAIQYRVGSAHLAMAGYRRFGMLCAADPVDEAAVLDAWNGCPDLQQTPLALLATVDGLSLEGRAALAAQRVAAAQAGAVMAAEAAALQQRWTDRVVARQLPPSRLMDELGLLLERLRARLGTTLGAGLAGRLGTLALPRLSLPRLTLPALSLPRPTLPKLMLPRPTLPRPTLPRPTLPRLALPALLTPRLRGLADAAAGQALRLRDVARSHPRRMLAAGAACLLLAPVLWGVGKRPVPAVALAVPPAAVTDAQAGSDLPPRAAEAPAPTVAPAAEPTIAPAVQPTVALAAEPTTAPAAQAAAPAAPLVAPAPAPRPAPVAEAAVPEPPARAAPTPTRPVVAVLPPQGARIRSAPFAQAPVARVVAGNARLRVFERAEGWVQVGDDQPWGWVNARLVAPVRG